jgi:hypothetical protein
MSNIVTLTQVQDGPSDVVYRYYFESDGVSGELNNFVLIDPANLTTGQNAKPWLPPGPYTSGVLNIQQVWYNLDGFDLVLGFQSANSSYAVALTPSTDSYIDFRPFGGFADITPIGDVPTGRIICKTNGFTTKGCVGFLVMKVRKMRPGNRV